MTNPYESAPEYRRWSRAVSAKGVETDPIVRWPWRLRREDKVAAAGSCFAQHIARHLKASGFAFLDAEPAHPMLGEAIGAKFSYGAYSARFGNIYSSRQLLQLFRRARGTFTPQEDVWEQEGRFFDPWRPAVQPGGFATRREFDLDREKHLSAVRRMFEALDVFVFTLGLTETWIAADGAAFPMCPGTVAGTFDPARHTFVNLGVDDVVQDLTAFAAELRAVNPKARVIFTVSPVPLVATVEDRHVLVATTLSKAVLRAAVDRVCQLEVGVYYFPSYEIITGPHARGRYFADDLRSVTERGVERVMQLFFRHVAGEEFQSKPVEAAPDTFRDAMHRVVGAMCDEEMLDTGTRG